MLEENETKKADNVIESLDNIENDKDIINILLDNEKDFIDIIIKILNKEFDSLFPKILNLPKIDFLNQLTSNVTFILTERFSQKILENEKCISLITSTCHSYDKKYNKYTEELSKGWEQYNLNNINILENSDNSYFCTNFRKHCHKTQNIAIHLCNKNGKTGNFISIYSTSDKKRIKYLICDNCRKSYFIQEFINFCKNCNLTYLCSSLYKNENSNFLSATLNPPHCETFVNEEIPCEKCKNILYIDLKNNLLKCGNENCNYNINLKNDKKINFKCKLCKNYFLSNVKIYNPIDVFHFKDIINKALLYKRKAFPGKLSCCNEIKEKKTDFYHKKDCKGKLYLAEYNEKMIIICSKCKAVNQYSKFIWTCPECGIHFRDKKSEINELKIRKTKSSTRMNKSKSLLLDYDKDNFSTVISGYNMHNSNKKKSLAEIIKNRKRNDKNDNIDNIDNICYSTGFQFYSCKKKLDYNDNLLSERNSYHKNKNDNFEDNNYEDDYNKLKINGNKKIKRGYLLGKILPWGTPNKSGFDNPKEKNEKNEAETEEKKEYYDKKVNDLINPSRKDNNLYHSGRVFYKRMLSSNDSNFKNDEDKSKEKNIKINEFKLNEYYDLDKNLKENNKIDNNQTIESIGFGFNRKKYAENKNNNNNFKEKDSTDLKYKKYSPIKLKGLYNTEQEQSNFEKTSNKNDDKNNNNNYKNNFIYISRPNNKNKDNSNGNSGNNKESWQSKETTAKGSVESKNSILSHSPQKEYNDKKVKSEEFNQEDEGEEDIIPYELIDQEQCVFIEENKFKENETLYRQIQRRLKRIISKGRLPRFDLEKFTIEKQIGDGSFGTIYSIYNNKTKKRYAMKKIIANDTNSLELYQKEFEIAHREKHPSILDIKGTYIKCFDETTFVLYVLMDLAEKDWEMEINERKKLKKYYHEDELIFILKQLADALFHLQKKSIAHRDIKPENILLFNNNNNNENNTIYKLCDFGEAKDYYFIHSKKQKTLRGTELYMSPLLYDGLVNDNSYVEHDAYKSDVFSLGCCIIIAMNLDFDIINDIRKLKEQEKIKEFLQEKLKKKYSDKFLDIVMKMINFNEKERIDFIQLQNFIEKNF